MKTALFRLFSLACIACFNQNCAKSPKELCTSVYDSQICVTQATINEIEDADAKSFATLVLEALKGQKETLVDQCAESYEKVNQQCKDAFAQLEKCLLALDCKASTNNEICTAESNKLTELDCNFSDEPSQKISSKMSPFTSVSSSKATF